MRLLKTVINNLINIKNFQFLWLKNSLIEEFLNMNYYSNI